MAGRMSKAHAGPARWRKNYFRPQVESLEDRAVPNSTPLDPGSAAIPIKHSMSGAARTLWLDFDGLDQAEAHDWGWTGPADTVGEGVGSLIGELAGGPLGGLLGGFLGGLLSDEVAPDPSTPRFDLDGNVNFFTANEVNAMNEIWARVSEDYAPFNIDVTTERPAAFGDHQSLRVSIGGDASWVPFNTTPGIGLPPSLHLDSNDTVFVFSDNVRQKFDGVANRYIPGLADTAAHEAGHGLGLLHQSDPNPIDPDTGQDPDEEYHIGTGERGPIMGNPYPEARTTWWVGEAELHGLPVAGAGATQDDMAVLAAHLGYNTSNEHGAFLSNATTMTFKAVAEHDLFDTVQNAYESTGAIERLDDVDTFRVHTDGPAQARINLVRLGTDLDPDLILYDVNGNQVAVATRAQNYALAIPSSGTWYLQVRGHAATSAEIAAGYVTYGNAGNYQVTVRETAGPVVMDSWHARNYSVFHEPMAIHVRFNKPVDPASFTGARVELRRGTGFLLTVKNTDIHVQPNTNSTEFYISMGAVPLRGYSLKLLSGITDRFGNRLDNNGDGTADDYYVERFDTRKPELQSIEAVTGAVRVTFSEAIDGPSFPMTQITAVTDSRGVAMTVTGAPRLVTGSGGCTWEIPVSGVPVGGFSITLGTSIIDLWGNNLNSSYRSKSFTDLSGPRVIDAYLADTTTLPGAGSLRSQTVVVKFNERIDTRTLTLDDVRVTDASGAAMPIVGIGPGADERGLVATFMPPPLASGTFTVTIGPDICDVYGNRMDQDNDGAIGLNMRDAGQPATLWQPEARQDDFDFTVVLAPLATRRSGWVDFESWMRMIARGELRLPPLGPGPNGPEEYKSYFLGILERGKYGIMPSDRMLTVLAMDGKFDDALVKEAQQLDAILRKGY